MDILLCSDISLLLALVKIDIRGMKFEVRKGYNQFSAPGSSEQAAEVLRESRMPR